MGRRKWKGYGRGCALLRVEDWSFVLVESALLAVDVDVDVVYCGGLCRSLLDTPPKEDSLHIVHLQS